jgi:hypothetical protein
LDGDGDHAVRAADHGHLERESHWDASGNVMTMRPNGNGNLPAGGARTSGSRCR